MPILLAESSGPTASRSSHTIGRRRWADCKPKCQQGVAESAKHRPTSPIHRPISLWPTSSRKGGFRLFLARPIYSLLFVVMPCFHFLGEAPNAHDGASDSYFQAWRLYDVIHSFIPAAQGRIDYWVT